MRTIRVFYILVAAALAVSVFSCRSSRSKDSTVVVNRKSSSTGHLPPGHAKKLNGDKSAKAYAPGQQKKKTKKGKG